ncbi:hypothetical protein H9655_08280 [Cytobacillus sp. Sa5YUA1]|uniref:DUF3895 domain-containing protein n=1 Tax=Cytobacillus stercorigallinarum TaxID=2762240 RepID=A0ABR8QND2_9BACI|nr:hypothetical protein [Cytobacillus stercorigallinarum]MBD7937026.1 hypothetical protein [Cytobacillus stercorigallinarum]
MNLKHQADMAALPTECPPETAKSEDIEVAYRFIKSDLVTEEDFLSHKEENKKYPPYLACQALAVSFFVTEEHARKVAENNQYLGDKKLVKGRITSECGKHRTKRGHINLWLCEDVDMKKVFLGE